ncbi:MAG: SUMF1/EgtB/PvdO family nonheme iron enzyme [Treponema sp.]|jgi:hypothetical protein|nr:SUMF1/EgtB/PvdO family nonheme iron enzyme [Treponema sp.]
MNKKPAAAPRQTEDDRVKLKPLMGIRPGVYLTVFYSIALLIILFFLLIFPGLKRPGSLISLKTEPVGAALKADGVYMGTYRDKIFIPKGNHILEAVIPGFETATADVQIPGRVFGSLFFPSRYRVFFTLKSADSTSAFEMAAADFAAWSFGGEPTAAWQIPLSLSEGAYRIGPENNPAATEILLAASRFTVTRSTLRDLVRAKMLIDSGGLSPSPAILAGSVSDILSFLSENPASAIWLSKILPPESAAIIEKSDWYKSSINFKHAPAYQNVSNTGTLAAGGLTFTRIESGTVEYPEPYPYTADVKNFYICETPVQNALFREFLNENPSWNDERNIFPPEIPGTYGAGASWHAARAFCQWFTKRLPSSMSNMEVRLPTEDEWEHAANSGTPNMKPANWEWCADPFVPLPFIKADQKTILAVGSPEYALRGRLSNTSETRASMPPDSASPFITFRPVLAEK